MIATHDATLIKILAIAKSVFPERINSTVSKLKVENVLKPPQNPITISILSPWLSATFSLNTPNANARIRVLNTFEINVAKGNELLKYDFTKNEMP